MRVAFDSNVMIYAEGADDNDGRRRDIALNLLNVIPPANLLIPIQAVGETLRWLIRKGGFTKKEAVVSASRWVAKYPIVDTNLAVFDGAGDLVSRHAFQVWDAFIFSAAATGGADVLLSEDMQDGFVWRGVAIANPFAANPSTLVRTIMDRR